MALAYQNFKTADFQIVTGITFTQADTETSFAHTMGVVPDLVIPIQTSADADHNVSVGATSPTSSLIYLEANNASATASALLVKFGK